LVLRWIDSKHLLAAASVDTASECGAQAGFTEGHILGITDGMVQQRMSLEELRRYPGVCLWPDNEN
jgi:hypothetical protein